MVESSRINTHLKDIPRSVPGSYSTGTDIWSIIIIMCVYCFVDSKFYLLNLNPNKNKLDTGSDSDPVLQVGGSKSEFFFCLIRFIFNRKFRHGIGLSQWPLIKIIALNHSLNILKIKHIPVPVRP
jgi:hypothetical protein